MLRILLLLALTVPVAAQQRDNVMLIIGDDLGVDRIASFAAAIAGTKPAPTPGIDALGDLGVRFTRAYSQCVCSPTRTAMLTGRQAFRTGIGTSVPWGNCSTSANGCFQWDHESLTTLPQALSATHATAAFGKWHVTSKVGLNGSDGWQHPIDVGFDYFSGAKQNLSGTGGLSYSNWERNQADANGNAQALVAQYATTVNVDDALQWIGAQGGKPWFTWIAFNAAHTPLHSPPAQLTTIPASTNPTNRHRAMVEAMDTEMIRLILGIRPVVRARTWFIFVGDNGDPPSTLSFAGGWPPQGKAKPNPWEGNVRVPLVIMGPRIDSPGREISQPVHALDLFATICDLVRVRTPKSAADSISLAPVLLDAQQAPKREYAFGERFVPNGFGPYTTYQWYVSDGRWKVGKYSQNGNQSVGLGGLKFFDLSQDISEGNNLLVGTLDDEQQAALDQLLAARDTILEAP